MKAGVARVEIPEQAGEVVDGVAVAFAAEAVPAMFLRIRRARRHGAPKCETLTTDDGRITS